MKYLTSILFLSLIFSCGDSDPEESTLGEACSGMNPDCAAGLVCTFETCALPNMNTFTCTDVCSRVAECGESVTGCESECRITVNKWDTKVKEVFSDCLSKSQCSDIKAKKAQQICYDKLPVSDYEKDRCDETSKECDLNDSFRSDCYRLAKVGSQSQFQSFDSCAQKASENLSCDTYQSCIDSSAAF